MSLTIPLAQAERVRQNYLCSDCWEALIEAHQDSESMTLTCITPDCPNRGMVSWQYVEKRECEAKVWLRNIRKQLAEKFAWVNPLPKRTSPQLLTMLGYY